MRGFRALLVGTGALTSAFSLAIIPDFGEDLDFTGVGRVGNASGVAVASNWVITARHVGGVTVNFGSGNIDAIQRFDHPLADISLLKFAGNPFSTFYEMDFFGSHLGQTATLVGFGETGTYGTTGINITGGGGTRRKANNALDDLQNVSFGPGSLSRSYMYDLDDPNGGVWTLGGAAVGNEGGLWGGDSGGGMFINGKLVAVNSFIFDAFGGGSSDWGDGGGGVHLGSYTEWINTTMAVPEPGTMVALSLGALALLKRKRSR